MSLEHILISYEEYERLKTIEREFEKQQKKGMKDIITMHFVILLLLVGSRYFVRKTSISW